MSDEGIEALKGLVAYVDEADLLSDAGLAYFLERTKMSREEFLAEAKKILKEAKE
jgi:hypothetical protein